MCKKNKQANKHKLMEKFDTFWTQITKAFSSRLPVEEKGEWMGLGQERYANLLFTLSNS